MSDWWANKLGGGQPPAATPPRPTYQPRPPLHAPAALPAYAPPVTAANMSEALANGVPTKGGDGAKAGENQSCPMCGSNHFFTNRTATDEKGQRGPASRCFSCGFTENRQMQGAPPQ